MLCASPKWAGDWRRRSDGGLNRSQPSWLGHASAGILWVGSAEALPSVTGRALLFYILRALGAQDPGQPPFISLLLRMPAVRQVVIMARSVER